MTHKLRVEFELGADVTTMELLQHMVSEKKSALSLPEILEQAQPHPEHDWIMPSALVAQGYDVDPSTLRTHKQKHGDELKEGIHWLKDGPKTLWTKRGVVQLGFKITSEAGNKFRKMAEEMVIEGLQNNLSVASAETTVVLGEHPPSQNIDALADAIAQAIAPAIQERHLMSLVTERLPAALDQNFGTAGEALGKSLSMQYGMDLVPMVLSAISSFQKTTAEVTQ